MEQIIEAFGIDARLIVIQIVNFVILMTALGYFLYTPVLNMLKAREESIAQGIKDAEAAAQAKSAAESEKATVLTAAHGEAKEIETRATAAAAEKAAVLTAEADAKAAQIMQRAEAEATALKSKIERETEAEIAKISLLAAEKVMRERAS